MAPRYTTDGLNLWYGGHCFGPDTVLHIDQNELPGVVLPEGIMRHASMPARLDMVMVADGVVIGCEVKKVEDLITSINSKRLARQLRTLREQVDRAVLVIRGNPLAEFAYTRKHDGMRVRYDDRPASMEMVFPTGELRSIWPIMEELTRWQMLGAIVLFAPLPDDEFGACRRNFLL